MEEFDHLITYEEKSLLLHCINTYLEKLDFVINNSKYFCTSDFVIIDLKSDREKLKKLQKKIFLVEVKHL